MWKTAGVRLPEEELTLAEMLKERGYTTAAFLSSGALNPNLNLIQGFDLYKETWRETRKRSRPLATRYDLTSEDALQWIDNRESAPFLLWVHYNNAHYPYKAPDDLAEPFFKDEQYAVSLQVNKFGNTYSGCSPVGLAAVLDVAKPEERILITSYGSGAGSDAYLLRTTSQLIDKRQRQKINVNFQAENPFLEYVDYNTYRRLKLGM